MWLSKRVLFFPGNLPQRHTHTYFTGYERPLIVGITEVYRAKTQFFIPLSGVKWSTTGRQR